jgi:hypothetical protein
MYSLDILTSKIIRKNILHPSISLKGPPVVSPVWAAVVKVG